MEGQLFFASTEGFLKFFKNKAIMNADVTIDFSESHVWDDSAVGALLKVRDMLESSGNTVHFTGLDQSSEQLIAKITGVTLPH